MFPSKHCLHWSFQFDSANHINESKVHLIRYEIDIIEIDTIDSVMIIAIKFIVVQDIYDKESKSYLQVSDKENQTSVSNSIETLN